MIPAQRDKGSFGLGPLHPVQSLHQQIDELRGLVLAPLEHNAVRQRVVQDLVTRLARVHNVHRDELVHPWRTEKKSLANGQEEAVQSYQARTARCLRRCPSVLSNGEPRQLGTSRCRGSSCYLYFPRATTG